LFIALDKTVAFPVFAKMSRLPMKVRRLAKQFGWSLRTIERKCETKKIGGAYQTKTGRWVIPERHLRKFVCAEINRRVKEKWRTLRRLKLRHPISLTLLMAGVTNDDIRAFTERPDWLKENYLEKWALICDATWELFCDSSTDGMDQLDSRVRKALNDPRTILLFAVMGLRLHGQKPTPRTLADYLHISPTTLYDRYTRKKVREVCRPDSDLTLGWYRHGHTWLPQRQ
jgi:hypothetical protein